jgi:hypothetical protein
MKTNGTLITGILRLVALVLVLTTSAKAQTPGADFRFTTHSLISGVVRQEGATYLFTNFRGGVVKKQTIAVQQGFNSAMVNGLGQLPAGQYVTALNGPGYSYTQHILIAK